MARRSKRTRCKVYVGSNSRPDLAAPVGKAHRYARLYSKEIKSTVEVRCNGRIVYSCKRGRCRRVD